MSFASLGAQHKAEPQKIVRSSKDRKTCMMCKENPVVMFTHDCMHGSAGGDL